MKNKVISIIFLLFVILLLVAIFSGIKIGKIEVLSVAGLKEKNNQLNEKIQTASTLTTIDYPGAIDGLEDTYENYQVQKQKYEELSGFADEDDKKLYETKQYDIAYLWKTVGKLATKHNLTIGMDVKKASGTNFYNLYFTVSGEYINISEFIVSLENNSDLSFRIYDFKMSGSSDIISSSFTVKDVNIDPSTITNASSSTSNTTIDDLEEDQSADTTGENTTDPTTENTVE